MLAAQKKHYQKYVLKEKEEISEETAANFKHGTETEVHVIATVVGPHFVNTQNRQCILEVSPDGLITMVTILVLMVVVLVPMV